MLKRRQRSLRDKSVFITGAASGIGLATARRAADDGALLYLTDINRGALEHSAAAIRDAGGRVLFAESCDISDYAAVRALADRLTTEHGAMDVVMNIAGISTWGTVRSLEHRHWQRLVEVNLMGPIHVMETLVPPMIEAGRGGHLVNVSSAAGIIGMPWHAAYSATKFGLRGISEVLRFDLRRHRIKVSLVCPGGVDTGLTETIQIAGVDKESPAFRRAHTFFKKRAVTPDQAAAAILDGIRRNRYWVYTSGDIRLIHAVQRYLPFAYVVAMRAMHLGANRALPAVDAAVRSEDAA